MRSFPPKGYLGQERPYIHDCEARFSLSCQDATENSTIIPLCFMDPALVAPEAIMTNPEHGSFAVDGGANCFKESKIPELQLRFDIGLSKVARETDLIRRLNVNWAFIHTSFLDELDRTNEVDDATVKSVIEMAYTSTEVHPLYSGVDLPVHSNLDTDQLGLTTDVSIESVAFDKELYFDWIAHGSKGAKNTLRNIMPVLRTATLKRDFGFHRSGNKQMNPKCKSMEDGSFCGILFHVEVAGQSGQIPNLADVSDSATGHVDVNMKWRFPEWNKLFGQDVS